MGVPRMSEEKLRRLFAEENDEKLQGVLKRMRDQLLEHAATIMYDSATLPAKHLGEEVLPEPFSRRQQFAESSRRRRRDRW